MMPPLPQPVRRFALICVALELAALAGVLAGFGSGLRNLFLVLGGFWPGVLVGASPTFPGQGIAMIVSSAFLHGGPMHLMMNMLGLLWLGPMVVDRVGERAFWPLAGLSALGAGLVYTALATSTMPMVGASGVLFGLLGTVAVWTVKDRVDRRESLRPVVEQALVFLALNLALMLMAQGSIAWQAHLGGFVAGVLGGLLTWRRTGRATWA